jgi:DNA modification methylase
MTNAEGKPVSAALAIDPLKIELRPLASLKLAPTNARTHSDEQIAQLMGSITKFGFLDPLAIDENDQIVAGHGRFAAATRLGLSDVPVIPLAHLTPVELRAYALAHNKIAANADWDVEKLRIEVIHVNDIMADMAACGFTTTEIDIIVDDRTPEEKLNDQPTLERKATPGVERGDLWLLGDHRLLCGDSREPASFARLMDGELARMVFSDPPYNVKIDGHVGGLGATRHAEFAMASGEMSQSAFTAFLQTVFRNAADVSIDGAIHYQCMDWRHMGEMLAAGNSVYSGLQNLCVWAKDSAGMGSFYRSQHEFVFVWKVGIAPHLNTVALGSNGRHRTNVWRCRAATRTGDHAELALHPTVKPVPLVIDAIEDTSKQREIVLDPFGGSGSTLIAAHKSKRRARLIEYEPSYCEVTIRRWQEQFGGTATLADTGETFDAVFARRGEEMERAADAALDMGEAV